MNQERDRKETERQKNKWTYLCNRDMESMGLKVEDEMDRTKWEKEVQNHSGDTRRREKPEKKKKTK